MLEKNWSAPQVARDIHLVISMIKYTANLLYCFTKANLDLYTLKGLEIKGWDDSDWTKLNDLFLASFCNYYDGILLS